MIQQHPSPTKPFRPIPLCMETEDQQLERLENEQEQAEMKYGLQCARNFRRLAEKGISFWDDLTFRDYLRIKQVSSRLIPPLEEMVFGEEEE